MPGKQLDYWSWAKIVGWVLGNATLAAAVGAWNARGSVADLHEKINQNRTEIGHHSERFDNLRAEFDRELKLREQTQDGRWQEMIRRFDGLDQQMREVHQDVREIRRNTKPQENQ